MDAKPYSDDELSAWQDSIGTKFEGPGDARWLATLAARDRRIVELEAALGASKAVRAAMAKTDGARIEAAESRAARAEEVLGFYADPDTYRDDVAEGPGWITDNVPESRFVPAPIELDLGERARAFLAEKEAGR